MDVTLSLKPLAYPLYLEPGFSTDTLSTIGEAATFIKALGIEYDRKLHWSFAGTAWSTPLGAWTAGTQYEPQPRRWRTLSRQRVCFELRDELVVRFTTASNPLYPICTALPT